MFSSESINELATALCKAQAVMGGAVKGTGNPFFKSKYANLSDVMQVVKEPFAANGLSYVQFPVSTENSVGVATRLMHTSGQWLEQEFLLPMVKRDPQAGGSCITYARRYGLAAMAGIPQVDDDAESAMLRGDDNKVINAKQLQNIKALLESTDSDAAKFSKAFKCANPSKLLAVHYDRAMAALEAKAK
jgi:hypothetical protein